MGAQELASYASKQLRCVIARPIIHNLRVVHILKHHDAQLIVWVRVPAMKKREGSTSPPTHSSNEAVVVVASRGR